MHAIKGQLLYQDMPMPLGRRPSIKSKHDRRNPNRMRGLWAMALSAMLFDIRACLH